MLPALVVSVVAEGAKDDPPVFVTVKAPEELSEASPDTDWVAHWEPEPTRMFPDVGVVVPRVEPLIFATVVVFVPAGHGRVARQSRKATGWKRP